MHAILSLQQKALGNKSAAELKHINSLSIGSFHKLMIKDIFITFLFVFFNIVKDTITGLTPEIILYEFGYNYSQYAVIQTVQ